jgi:nitric oxide reductase activation protein
VSVSGRADEPSTAQQQHTSTDATLTQYDDDDIDASPDERDIGNLLSSPVGGGGPLGKLLRRFMESTRERAGTGPAGADALTHVGRARPRDRGAVFSRNDTPVRLADLGNAAPHRTTYPEWDVHRRRYRPDWCTVVEVAARTEDRPAIPTPDTLAFRRALARLGMGLDRCHRRPQGDDIDIDAAIEARVQALAGSAPDDGVYVEALRRRRDLSVLLLLDISGSAGEPGPNGKTVHEHQRTAAAALTAALAELGDRVAVYAFNSRGRAAVQVTTVKPFVERLDSRAFRRLGGLEPGAYTRLGAAIRHGTSLVEGGGTPQRLLVVLSDGFAYDNGYEGAYGEADARRALAEARRRGVGCLCLSVGARTSPIALRRVFGTAAHAAVPTHEHLPVVIGPLFRAALRSAELQRRTFQRTERTRELIHLDGRTA